MRRGGFILLAMLGLLLVTSSLGLAVSLRARARVARADLFASVTRTESAARAAVLAAVDSASTVTRAELGGSLHMYHAFRLDTLGDVVVTTEVTDLAARVHINVADDRELHRFLVSSGVGPRDSDVAAQSIADWRDSDDLHRARGAEAAWYRLAGLHYGPSNQPVTTHAELGLVRVVSAQILERLERGGSLHGDGRMNVNSAPLPVLASLPGMSVQAAAAVRSRRSRLPLTNVAEFFESVPLPWRRSIEENLRTIVPRLSFRVEDLDIRARAMAGRAVTELHVIAHHTGDGRYVVTRAWYSS